MSEGEAVDYRELLLGCGYTRRKLFTARPDHPPTWRSPTGPVTLDINRACQPDIMCDLNQATPWYGFPRVDPEGCAPYSHACLLEPDYWDEIHAYQVLEHLGRQGDAHSFLSQFAEIWRILKPGGYLVASVPSRFSLGLWGDPSHARVINEMSLTFLDQGQYIQQCDGDAPTGMSDFRGLYKADFDVLDQLDTHNDFIFILQAVKPSRWRERPL